ncbi:ATP-binding protein [Bradyrhizobium sp. USDA 336]|uniref:ATP-binding protein n=1 Tax=Bradyrhizobium sp. USDA 336 TaxID=3156311 RepID=UPI0038362383
MLREREIVRKDHRRIEMALKLAHFLAVEGACGLRLRGSDADRSGADPRPGRVTLVAKGMLLLGPPGVGNSAAALGREAILAGYSVQFTSAATLVAGLAKARGERRPDEKLLALAKPKLLIVHELGYLLLEPGAAHLFFQLFIRRYESGAILITSNRSVAECGIVFAYLVVATAILNRLLHHSHMLTILDDSYGLRAK